MFNTSESALVEEISRLERVKSAAAAGVPAGCGRGGGSGGQAEADRTVTIRPAPDTMTYVTAPLPVATGVGVYAALNKPVKAMQPCPRPRRSGLWSISGTHDVYVG
jgi:hypothetical protein